MSRRIPPTPVAAPWYGSTALGWLCDSILNATASPSPIEITPAFSPGPGDDASAAVPVGSVRSSGRELLYEQCSLHITLNIASSRSFGSRPPSRSRIASSSSSVRPSAAVERLLGVAVTGALRARVIAAPTDDGRARRRRSRSAALATNERDDPEAVVGAEDRLDRASPDAASGRRRCPPRSSRPAIARSEPFGFARSSSPPAGAPSAST